MHSGVAGGFGNDDNYGDDSDHDLKLTLLTMMRMMIRERSATSVSSTHVSSSVCP